MNALDVICDIYKRELAEANHEKILFKTQCNIYENEIAQLKEQLKVANNEIAKMKKNQEVQNETIEHIDGEIVK